MQKNITNEKLAEMIREGFAGNDKRFNVLERRFTAVEKEVEDNTKQSKETKMVLKSLAGDIAEIKVHMEEQRHEERIKSLERRIGRVERLVEQAQ